MKLKTGLKKLWRLSKSAFENFSLAAGVIGLIFSIIVIFAPLPFFATMLITGAVSLIFTVVGTYYAEKKHNHQKEMKKAMLEEKELRTANEIKLVGLTEQMEVELKEIKQELDHYQHPQAEIINIHKLQINRPEKQKILVENKLGGNVVSLFGKSTTKKRLLEQCYFVKEKQYRKAA